MNMTATVDETDGISFYETILLQGELISDKLNMLRLEHYPPDAVKSLRSFSLAEVAYFLGVTSSNIKKLHLEGKGPTPTTSASGAGPIRPADARAAPISRPARPRGRQEICAAPTRRRTSPDHRRGEFQGRQRQDDDGAHLAQHLALTAIACWRSTSIRRRRFPRSTAFSPSSIAIPRSTKLCATTTPASRFPRSFAARISRPRHRAGQSRASGI